MSYQEGEKIFQQIAGKFIYFTCIFINYSGVIDNCWYLLLFDKILRKTKTFLSFHVRNNELKEIMH